MSYLSQLTEDEVRFICSVIPHRDTVTYFTKHPKDFTKIRSGFRANTLSKTDISNLLFSYRNKLFISKYIEKNIKVWLVQIQEHMNKYLKDGASKELAIIHTLPFSFFANNVNIYFKLVNEEYSDEYIALLNVTVKAIREEKENREKLNQEIEALESTYQKLKTEIESKEVELEVSKNKLTIKLSELDTLNNRISMLEKLQDIAKDDKEIIEALKKEKVGFVEKIDLLSKELIDVKNNSLLLERKILTELEEKQRHLEERKNFVVIPKGPCDILEFKEYLGYNFTNIGLTSDTEYYPLLIEHLGKILFQGLPIIVNRAIGLNLIKCVANSLIGNPNVQTMSYSKDTTVERISQFLQWADRVVCLDNFIGNFNEIELIPLLETHKDKMIFLTVVYDRTLHYLSREFKRYYCYLNANRIGMLSANIELTEDPSTIKEHSFMPKYVQGSNRFQTIFREILQELSYSQSMIEHCCASITSEEDLCRVLAFDILPYCADVMQISPYNTSERLIKYAGKDGRCPQKNLLMRWFA